MGIGKCYKAGSPPFQSPLLSRRQGLAELGSLGAWGQTWESEGKNLSRAEDSEGHLGEE